MNDTYFAAEWTLLPGAVAPGSLVAAGLPHDLRGMNEVSHSHRQFVRISWAVVGSRPKLVALKVRVDFFVGEKSRTLGLSWAPAWTQRTRNWQSANISFYYVYIHIYFPLFVKIYNCFVLPTIRFRVELSGVHVPISVIGRLNVLLQ